MENIEENNVEIQEPEVQTEEEKSQDIQADENKAETTTVNVQIKKKSFVKESNKEKVEEPTKEAKTVKEEKAVVSEDLASKTVAELRDMAKAKDIKGYSTMKKSELVDALK